MGSAAAKTSMALGQLAWLLALRRLLERMRAASEATSAQPADHAKALRYFTKIKREVPAGFRQSARHGWLALEIALGGPALWDPFVRSLPAAPGNIFRQQMEGLLDLFALAGLGNDSPDARRLCWVEIRSARQANHLVLESLDALDPAFFQPAGADRLHAERLAVEHLANEFREAGYSNLAQLVSLRSGWGEPLLIGILEYFLYRALRCVPEFGWDLAELPEDNSAICWRSLDLVARLLEEGEEPVEAVLDRPEDTVQANAVEERSQAAERVLRQGLERLQYGDYRQAVEHFTAALKLDSSNAALYTHRGEAYRLQCEYERAIADYHAALRLEPAGQKALLGRAQAYHLSGEHKRAIADCGAALSSDPGNPLAHRVRAAAHMELGDPELALADLAEVLSRLPDDAEALYQRAVIRAEQRAFAEAIADCSKILAANSHHVPALLTRGHAHLHRNDYASSIRDYSEVLHHHRNNVLALGNRGRAHQLKGDPERALADYSEALRLEPDNVPIRCRRGVLLRVRGDLKSAIADLDEAIRLDSENSAARYHRGKIALAQGRFADAVADLDEAVHLQPKLVVGYLSRALAQHRLGRPAESLADAQRALRIDPRSGPAYFVRGILLLRQGDAAGAVRDLTRALEDDDKLIAAYQERAIACNLQGEAERALADCDRVLAAEPRHAAAYLQRSLAHHALGHLEQSLADYARALAIEPKIVQGGCNDSLGESFRNQQTQRTADYLDGLRPAPQTGEVPTVPALRIGTGAKAETPAATVPPTAPVTVAPPAPRQKKPAQEPRTPVSALAQPVVATPPPPEPLTDVRGSEELPEVDFNDIVLEPDDEDVQDTDSQPERLNSPEPPAPPIEAPRPSSRVGLQPLRKLIDMESIGIEPPEPTPAKAPPAPKPRARKAVREGEESPLLEMLKQPVPMAVGGVALLILVYLFFPWGLFRGSDRLTVYAAQGKLEWEGKPLADGALVLHPVGVKEPDFPVPRAVAREDGTFVVGTYAKDDGAPEGEYKVTVQWFKKPPRGSEDAPPPRNILPQRYARPDTSDLTLRIEKGENQLPTLKLRR